MNDKTSSELRPVWFVGASWGGIEDQTDRFLEEGIWEHGFRNNERGIQDRVREMRVGDRIAIKAWFTRKEDHPFETGGRAVAMMGIKATGTITRESDEDGVRVEVEWREAFDPFREWRFFVYNPTLWKIDLNDRRRYPPERRWLAEALIAFAFEGAEQDIARFLRWPKWQRMYPQPDAPEESLYTAHEIWEEGSFVDETRLNGLLARLRQKKNLILQGPPGTGKSWLAKRLGFALIGAKDPDKVSAVQFHPSLSYEDFVRGFRPVGDGRLESADGIFLRVVNRAVESTDTEFVVVIEEINRGNPAQIFGELLTLLETDKRTEEEAIELPHAGEKGDRVVHVPDNIHVIGTMNLADRSLAMVDFALRRRFAFATLQPEIGERWQAWVADKCGVDADLARNIGNRIRALNDVIRAAPNLGPNFCVGHSFVTPAEPLASGTTQEWFREVVETEIAPLLAEYWFDEPKRATEAVTALLEDW